MVIKGTFLSTYEPRCEKTSLPCFRPGPTQTRLYNNSRWLEACNFGFRNWRDCTIYVAKTKALISCAVMSRVMSKPVFWISNQVRHKPSCNCRRWLEVRNFGFSYRAADLHLCFRTCEQQFSPMLFTSFFLFLHECIDCVCSLERPH